jgi:hypothetical protein
MATAAMGPGWSRRQKPNVEIVVSSRRSVGVYSEFWPTKTSPRLHCSCNIAFVLESFLSNVGIALRLYPPQHEQCIRFLPPGSMYGQLSPLSHVCTFVPFL